MPIKPMSPEEAVEEATDIISACFEGFMLGQGKPQRTHPEIKDEFRLAIRTALASVIAWAAEECRPDRDAYERVSEQSTRGFDCASNDYHAALLKAAEEIDGV